MYRSELHSIIVKTLEKATWTRSTRDEDNFRQVICSHLYEYISPNNTEIPSTRSGSGDIKVFGRKIELKYVNAEKRDKLDDILSDIDLLIDSKVEFCIVAIRFTINHKDNHLARAVDLPHVPLGGASAPVANHAPHNYYGPGIFLPACWIHSVDRISITENSKSKKTNSYISVELVHNIERSCFIKIGNNILHVDVIGSKEDGLLTFLYKRADEISTNIKDPSQDICIPYSPAPLKIASFERVDIFSQPSLTGRKVVMIEEDKMLFKLD